VLNDYLLGSLLKPSLMLSKRNTLEELFDFLVLMQMKFHGQLGIEFKCLANCLLKVEQLELASIGDFTYSEYSFSITKNMANEFHIDLTKGSGDLKVPREFTRNKKISIIRSYLLNLGIFIIYGKFMDRCHENYMEVFYSLNKIRVSTESFKKFIEGCKNKRIPNSNYQREVGINRSTYYKLINFMESIVPYCWNKGNLDPRRLVSEETQDTIRSKIFNYCKDEHIKEIWERDFRVKRSYMEDKKGIYDKFYKLNPGREEFKERAKSLLKHNLNSYEKKVKNYCRKLGRNLKKLKKLENRLPLLFPDMNVYNILKISKRRPCPVNPYIGYLRHVTPKFQVQKRCNLMKSIRERMFVVNRSLKKESWELEWQRSEEKSYIKELKYKALVKEKRQARKDKKRQENLLRDQAFNEKYESYRHVKALRDKFAFVLNELANYHGKIEKQKKLKLLALEKVIEKKMQDILKWKDSVKEQELLAKRRFTLSNLMNKKRMQWIINQAQHEESERRKKVRQLELQRRQELLETNRMEFEDKLVRRLMFKEKQTKAPLVQTEIKEAIQEDRDSDSYREKKLRLTVWGRGEWKVQTEDEDEALLEFKEFCHLVIQDKLNQVKKVVIRNDKDLKSFTNLPIKRIMKGVENYKHFTNFAQFEIERDNIIKEFKETLSRT
jgi:hypothetical protein